MDWPFFWGGGVRVLDFFGEPRLHLFLYAQIFPPVGDGSSLVVNRAKSELRAISKEIIECCEK